MNKFSNNVELIFHQLNSIADQESKNLEDLIKVFKLFSLFYEKVSENESIGFTSLFSRIAFISVRYNFPSSLIYYNHYFRRKLESRAFEETDISQLFDLGIYVIYKNSKVLYPEMPDFVISKPSLPEISYEAKLNFTRVIRTHVIEPKDKEGRITFISEDQAHIKKLAMLDNSDQLKQLEAAIVHLKTPLPVNFIDVEISEDGMHRPKGIVLLPDYLIGVTSISECFQSNSSFALSYLARKLVPTSSSLPILIGNIVNYLLDEIIHDPKLNFDDVLKNVFQIAPELFSTMSDSELRQMLSKVKDHFINLKEVVNKELKETGISKESAYLEPSFYSNEFGLYGRLDLYHYNVNENQSDIVELKSGKLYKSNSYGINENHYIQTLLYDLIIESLYRGKVKSNNYILYSYLNSQRLKYAPKVRSKQYASLLIRNDIVMIEHILAHQDDEKYAYLLDTLNPEKIPSEFTFVKRDAQFFFTAYSKLEPLEKIYYKSFISFLSREYSLSKTGLHGISKSNGLASLWIDPIDEKISQFTVLSYLKIVENNSANKIPIVTLEFTDHSNRISKFRVGDIVVMYPYNDNPDAVIRNQIFKCTILSLDNNQISIRLRARQKNHDIFIKNKFWNLEADILDSSYNQQFYGLYDFIHADSAYRKKIFGIEAADKPRDNIQLSNDKLSKEQIELLNAAINAQDYFLLWGPPGTGKTSVMIKHLLKYYYENTSQNILLLAYTNRAVDEICEAIIPIVGEDYIRIGSRYSTGENYKDSLLSVKTEKIEKRKTLKKILDSTKIFVSTISSYQGKRDLRQLKEFDIAIVDEASQLLEPMLVGLLSHFKKFVLIGDHKQLPAVVKQDKSISQISNTDLKEEIGLVDCRMSLFERMYKNCIKNEWVWSYGSLTFQGRMHKDILKFVSKTFYDNGLQIFQGIDRLKAKPSFSASNDLERSLIENRLIFIDTPVDSNVLSKTNIEEARFVSILVEHWSVIYNNNDLVLGQENLGIISPFRAQIAIIKNDIESKKLEDVITVDTIERYQGGARDHIIISLAINKADLLDTITNISDEGVDRKLNVALTRAKEHIIILGSKSVLQKSKTYSSLIDMCFHLDYKEFI